MVGPLVGSRRDHPLLVAADVKRPGAIDQLKLLGQQNDFPVYAEDGGRVPMICKRAVKHAAANGQDVVILDSAGRLAIDREMMDEVKAVAKKVDPHEIFLVCDAMTGQDAVRGTFSHRHAALYDQNDGSAFMALRSCRPKGGWFPP